MDNAAGRRSLYVLPEEPDLRKKTAQKGFRLSAGAIRRLEELERVMEVDASDVIDTSLKHLWGSYMRDESVHLLDPPPDAKKAEGGDNGRSA